VDKATPRKGYRKTRFFHSWTKPRPARARKNDPFFFRGQSHAPQRPAVFARLSDNVHYVKLPKTSANPRPARVTAYLHPFCPCNVPRRNPFCLGLPRYCKGLFKKKQKSALICTFVCATDHAFKQRPRPAFFYPVPGRTSTNPPQQPRVNNSPKFRTQTAAVFLPNSGRFTTRPRLLVQVQGYGYFGFAFAGDRLPGKFRPEILQ